MVKDKTLKKSSFLTGAFISTFGIIFTKIIGMIYVIPFHALIGEKGGALYSYAYTIYLFFISISSAGIPIAISKVVSEYKTLGLEREKERAFYLGKKISLILGVICFLILMLFAPIFAKLIIGDNPGGNTIEDITLVIRIVSSAILVVPILSIYRGYFEGHSFMSPPSISQVLEQLVRVGVILIGSFMVLNVFNLGLTTAVGVSVFAASIGALASYFYLFNKRRKNPSKFVKKYDPNDIKVDDNRIIGKILYYAFPLIMIDFFKSMYSFVDTLTIVKGLVKYGSYNVNQAESILSMLSTWGNKFNMVITAISTGLVVNLIPTLSKYIVNNDNREANKVINKSIGLCLVLTIPMTIGICILSHPIWNLFYGASDIGPTLLGYFIFTGLFSGLFTVLITITQVYRDYKMLFISLFSGVLIKILLNVYLIDTFARLELPPYYGVITATMLGYIVSIGICLYNLKINHKYYLERIVNLVIDILCAAITMAIVLLLVRHFIPVNYNSRLLNIFHIILYAVIGSVVYFISCDRTGILSTILGPSYKKMFKK